MLRAAEIAQLTDTGRQRRDNEDSMLARPPVFVVADGMGGARAGEVASRLAIEVFEPGLPHAATPEDRLALRVHEANRRIHALSRAQHERAGMGTTLTAALLDHAQLAIAHVGDSRAYLFRDGALVRLTQDHSLVQELVNRGKLTEEQAEEHPQRSIITRALGPEPSVDVDTSTFPARHGDVLLLCSDGLTSMVPEEKIVEILSAPASLEQAGDRLIAEANAAGGRDNITVILTRLEDTDSEDRVEAPTMVGAPTSAGDGAAGSAASGLGAARPATAGPLEAPGGTAGGSSAAAAARTTTSGAPAASALPEPTATPPPSAARVPLARTQGRPAEVESPPRAGRLRKPRAGLLAALIVLALIAGGGYLASRQLYFISTDAHGVVTIYRGLPYDLPAGIPLYETFYVSGVPAADVPVSRRASLFSDRLRSEKDAASLVRDLELGRLSG